MRQPARPVLLAAAAAPVLLLASAAYARDRLDLLRGALLLAAAIAGQSGINLQSAYFDLKNGVPAGGALRFEGTPRPGEWLLSAFARLAVAAAASVWLAILAGWQVGALAAAAGIFGYAYAADPVRYKYRPWGLPAVAGAGVVLGGAAGLALLGRLETLGWVIGLASGAWAAAIVHAGDLRDRGAMARAGFRPAAVVLGDRGSDLLYASLLLAGYAGVAALVVARMLPIAALAGLLTVPWALLQVRRALISTSPSEVARLDVRTARVLWAFAVLSAAGIVFAP